MGNVWLVGEMYFIVDIVGYGWIYIVWIIDMDFSVYLYLSVWYDCML